MENQSYANDTGGGDSFNSLQNNIIFGICVVATILHAHTWFQLVIQKTKFDLSFIFPLGYMLTDVILLLFYFIQYSIRIRPWIPVTTWFCYFEAYGMFHVNLFESYALTALNICRYWQVNRNRNVYKFHRRKVITVALLIPTFIFFNLIIQHIFGWCIVIEIEGNSCSLTYTNVFVQVWNIVIILLMPIAISFSLLFAVVHSLHHSHAQQAIIRRNHHRQLIIHSFIFYTVWLCLWFPLMLMTYVGLNSMSAWIVFTATIANTLEIAVDPVITFFLDKRFTQAYKKCFGCILGQLGGQRNARVIPIAATVAAYQTHTVERRSI